MKLSRITLSPGSGFPGTGNSETALKARSCICLLLFSSCLTILYQGMRGILYLGGFVASGGPYAIAHPAPGWVWVIPVSVIVLVITMLIGIGTIRNTGGPNLMALSWSALFLALGWNFLYFGLGLPTDGGLVPGWLICAACFIPMGAIPLWIILSTYFRNLKKNHANGPAFSWGFLLVQSLCTAGGVYLGMRIFYAVA